MLISDRSGINNRACVFSGLLFGTIKIILLIMIGIGIQLKIEIKSFDGQFSYSIKLS